MLRFDFIEDAVKEAQLRFMLWEYDNNRYQHVSDWKLARVWCMWQQSVQFEDALLVAR